MGEVRVHLRLWDACTGHHLWGDDHHHVLRETDLFEAQHEISRSAVTALRARVRCDESTPPRPTVQ